MTILVVDDDPEARERLERALRASGDGWDVRLAVTAKEGLALAGDAGVECVVLDYRLPDADGLTCLRELRRARPELPIVMITGSGSEKVAVDAMKLGAADYVVKHTTYASVIPGVVREALGRRALARLAADPSGGASADLPAPDPATLARFEADGFIARSPVTLRLLALLVRAAQSTTAVLIEGESGTGKDLCAHALHKHGPRAKRPFVAQNCAAVPETLLESELFGHARGAFTGADRAHAGVFEQADGGTLFLDEIGEASPVIQAKLLRVLEEREVRPLGATSPRRLDVRLVAATNRDLRRDGEAGLFRLDLFYRVRVFPIVVPPLRERREDVAALAEHFLERFAREEQKPLAGFDPETIALLEGYAWPGNVRELQNEVRRLVVCAEPGARIAPDALEPRIRNVASPETGAPLRDIMRQVETSVIQSRLREHGGHRDAAARSLGMRRETLWKKLRALGLVTPDADSDE